MSLGIYLLTWLVLTVFFSYEYLALNFRPQISLLLEAQKYGLIPESVMINSEPGRPLSLWLGWIGLSLMILMHIYTLRKKAQFMQNWGKASAWLNFHVFCGLLGPTLIFFHCNFKVRGIVAISFWSMVVSLASGIVGRYFYSQIARLKSELLTENQNRIGRLPTYLSQRGVAVEDDVLKGVLERVYKYVGIPKAVDTISPLAALTYSMIGDLRLLIALPAVPSGWPESSRVVLKQIGLMQRKAVFVDSFQRLMGYWHTFHSPFAIFMYAAAIIHVISALIFGV
jgi:hypothetical protein